MLHRIYLIHLYIVVIVVRAGNVQAQTPYFECLGTVNRGICYVGIDFGFGKDMIRLIPEWIPKLGYVAG